MDTETKVKLHKLKVYLDQLPDSLPFKNEAESDYGFDFFGTDQTDEEDIGVKGAVNRQLEIRLGHRNNGPVRLMERGPGITAVVSVLDTYLTELPASIILKKWLDDLISSAELAFEEAKCSLPEIPACGAALAQPSAEDSSDVEGENDQPRKTRKAGKLDSKILTSFDDMEYKDLPEVKDSRGTGVKILPLLLEAAKISVATKKYLSTCHHLTITFDGGKTRQPHSVYSVHVTTADRRTFCLELDDASRLSHTGEYIFESLDRIVTKIGPWRFCATSSDNTGNTQKARRLLCTKYPHILNLQDACHLLNLAIKAIALLPEFENVTHQIRAVLAFMSRSSYAMEHFDHKRNVLGITRGLEAVGDTRFGTLYWASRSVQRGLPAFRAIIEEESLGINISSLNELFTEGSSKLTFEFELSKLLSALGPWAKALKCLESAHVTADTIYFYWLAIMAQLDEDLTKNPYKMQMSTIEDIRAIANSRFNEMIEDAPNDTYIVAFFLNPEYRVAPIYKNQNPLAVPSVSVNQKKGQPPKISSKPPSDLIERVGLSLQKMLKHEYGDAYQNQNWADPKKQMAIQNPMLAKYHPMDALGALKDQLKAYAKGVEPFNRRLRPKTESTADWWAAVQQDEDGEVLGALAVKIFSAVPISMADERTMSTITWLNSPRRSSQGVGTLQDHIKIRQWHRYKPEKQKTPFKPVVHWRDMEATISSSKRKASELGEDSPVPGPARPQPRPFDPPADEDSESDTELGNMIDGAERGTEHSPIDDGARWLDKKRKLRGAAVLAERKKFTLGGRSDIDLSSPFFRDVLDDATKSRSQLPTASKTNMVPAKLAPKVVPNSKVSDWESW
ncbi:hypothetical protein HYDPIDRAFT_162797 [Hydnomerulius pinastri MD-312]|uniref:DUF659 domain-containing protein n=1 Tax=Hydnomerulius pinastri MD-312 TaxID=994086 RepID=A0A0C9W006_9AGAM|nr:hypothetical protein HYDPIDRAFT_162797 [Hydnomerulius pinastri MD-312]